YREKLEKYLERPSRCGVLTLEVMTWKSNTRLAKIIPEQQLFQCEPRSAKTMASFLAKWCKQQYQKNLSNDAVQLLIEQVEPDFGLLHQELAKLAVYVGDRESITGKDVDELVSRNRSSTVWLMLDALAANQPAEALGTLHQLLQRGEDPIGLFAGITWQLRKLAQTHRLIREGVSLQGAMAQAGLPPFKVQTVQQHLKLLGDRSNRIFEWLMEAEIALKSSTGTAPGTIVEKLLLRLT
ncbi:MAG TPA: DNA polymerase III subunit delta, partial [Gemmatales bacterium]|nr:DNA polymerase III subunit delta [Gemmatales bacterium]